MHVYPVEECHQKSCQKLHFPGTHKTTHIFGPQYTLDTPKNIFTPYVHIILYKNKFSNKSIPQQGDWNNELCNTKLPEYEFTVIRPPIGNPDFQEDGYWLINKTIYGIRPPPHNWYNRIKLILLKMGLINWTHNPWFIYGKLTNPPSTTCTPQLQSQLHFGLYVDEFLFYSSDTDKEELFKTLLQEHIKVDSMGNDEYLLDTTFNWIQHDNINILMNLCQSSFTGLTANWF